MMARHPPEPFRAVPALRTARTLVCDNYGTHKTPEIQDWLARHPRFHVHFTPTGSSWINQVPVNRPSARRHARAV